MSVSIPEGHVAEGVKDLVEVFVAGIDIDSRLLDTETRDVTSLIDEWFWEEFERRLERMIPAHGDILKFSPEERQLFSTGFIAQEAIRDYSNEGMQEL